MGAYFLHLKIPPAAGLTFQPAVFYWAYLQWGLAGSWGKPWQPNTASNSLQRFNNAARTQLFSTFCCVPKNLRASESLPHELLQVFRRHKTVTPFSTPFFKKYIYISKLLSFKADQSPKPDWGNWSGNALRDGFQVGNRAKFFFFFSANEAVIYMRKKKKLSYTLKCISEAIAISKSHWRLSNHTAVSLSLPPPPSPPSLPFHFIYTSHTFPRSHFFFFYFFTVSAPFSLNYIHVLLSLTSLPPSRSLSFFISVKECWSLPRSRNLNTHTHTHTHTHTRMHFN